jgi:hypothetical protein
MATIALAPCFGCGIRSVTHEFVAVLAFHWPRRTLAGIPE